MRSVRILIYTIALWLGTAECCLLHADSVKTTDLGQKPTNRPDVLVYDADRALSNLASEMESGIDWDTEYYSSFGSGSRKPPARLDELIARWEQRFAAAVQNYQDAAANDTPTAREKLAFVLTVRAWLAGTGEFSAIQVILDDDARETAREAERTKSIDPFALSPVSLDQPIDPDPNTSLAFRPMVFLAAAKGNGVASQFLLLEVTPFSNSDTKRPFRGSPWRGGRWPLICSWVAARIEAGDAEAAAKLAWHQKENWEFQSPDLWLTTMRKAADLGHADACTWVGCNDIYSDQPSRRTRGFEMVLKGAERGSILAMGQLSLFYWVGQGVIPDRVESTAWILVSREFGSGYPINNGHEAYVEAAAQRARELRKLIKAKSLVASISGDENPTVASGPVSGSGVFISSDGLVATAAHVVDGAKSIKVHDSSGAILEARLTAIDRANDVAILKVNGTFEPAALVAGRNVRLGQAAFTIGFPNPGLQGFSPKVTSGEISSTNGLQDDPRHWQISVPVQTGNSGGALFDRRGNVIGLVVSKLDVAEAFAITGDVPQNVNFAIKADFVSLLAGTDLKSRKPRTGSELSLDQASETALRSVVLVLAIP